MKNNTTNDFMLWLDSAEPQGSEELYALAQVLDGNNHSPYDTWQRGEIQFIRRQDGICNPVLIIASPKAKETFKSIVEERYCPETGSLELEASFLEILEQND